MSKPSRIAAATALAALALLAAAGPAGAASKGAIDFIGGSGDLGGQFGGVGGIAVNESGAGAGNEGDVYVADYTPSQNGELHNRIQRFGRDDSGTPGEPADDTYFFISAWGAGVNGGSDFGVCTVAAECQIGAASAANGGLSFPRFSAPDLALDQDTGELYVTDIGNRRINVYAGDGVFLRSFGYDVVESGPGSVAGPDEVQQLSVSATGGKFSLFFEGQSTGGFAEGVKTRQGVKTVTLPDPYSGQFAVGQAFTAIGRQHHDPFPAGTTIAAVEGSTLTLSEPASFDEIAGFLGATLWGDDLPHDASAEEIEAALNALPTIGGAGGSVTVSGSGPYEIEFGGALAGEGVPQIEASSHGLSGASQTAALTTLTEGGSYEVCEAADGDVCRAGTPGAAPGQLTEPLGVAVSAPDGEPASGAVYVADPANRRLGVHLLDGSAPSSLGSAARFGPLVDPARVAVDSRGIVYAATGIFGGSSPLGGAKIERYDSEDANGGGVGFLTPIQQAANEQQPISSYADSGQFRLSFDPDGPGPEPAQTTGDLSATNKSGSEAQAALEALPAIGAGNVKVGGNTSGFGGVHVLPVTFEGALAGTNVPELVLTAGSTPPSPAGSVTVETRVDGHPASGLLLGRIEAIASEGDNLYLADGGSSGAPIRQYGPVNDPGLTEPPLAIDESHGSNVFENGHGLAAEASTGRLYAAGSGGVYVLGEVSPTPPTATLDSVDGVTASSAVLHATVNPNGRPATSYHFEYSTDGASWSSTPEVLLGVQETPQEIEAMLEPGNFGLQPNTTYHVRVVAQRKFAEAVISGELTFTTEALAPLVETTGTPLRTTSTAQLLGRVDPRGSATSYHFEYGTQGPCDANPCEATATEAAGAGQSAVLVAAKLEGLQPDTTVHYRVVADNGVGSPVVGAGRTVTTRAGEAPLSHGNYPGPPGSDRAYEMVSLPDSGGNPVAFTPAIASSGERALYQVAGGTPISETGTLTALYLSQRDPAAHPTRGWQSQVLTPPRDQQLGSAWFLNDIRADEDLSTVAASNRDVNIEGKVALWQMSPESPAAKLADVFSPSEDRTGSGGLAADGSLYAVALRGGVLDPAFPAATAQWSLYSLGPGGEPRLVSLLPGGAVPACGVPTGPTPFVLPNQLSHWVGADGLVYFTSSGDKCSSEPQLYVRDTGAEATVKLSGPPVSGPACGQALIKALPGEAFFWTRSRLLAEDTEPSGCGGGSGIDGDVYRYESAGEALQCVTCGLPAGDADVTADPQGANRTIAVAEDGSRLYFSTSSRLLPEAPPQGTGQVYRIEVATGELAYLGPAAMQVGDATSATTLTPDGAQLYFHSSSPALDPLGGNTNGGASQVYRYDDTDRSLVCVSCPLDGSAPLASAATQPDPVIPGPTPLAANGSAYAFATATPLVPADQNTPPADQDLAQGADIYEWRDGRQLIVTDGLTNWEPEDLVTPQLAGISPSGRDLFFTAFAQLTPDALDGFKRFYDARIGGGIDFPPAPKPCPLEVCQGTPQGAPEEEEPASANFEGNGNALALRDCAPTARAAKRLSRRAKRLRGAAARSANPRRARAMRRRAQRLAKTAKRRSRAVKRCRKANRNRRAAR